MAMAMVVMMTVSVLVGLHRDAHRGVRDDAHALRGCDARPHGGSPPRQSIVPM